MRFWISWHQPTEDYRPLTCPPKPSVLGWWCTGADEHDIAILCALVEAPNEAAAKAAVRADWPEAERWRFCEEGDGSLNDRFPLEDWMRERIGAPANDKGGKDERSG